MLNFHYYEQRFQKLSYILTIEPIYRINFVASRDQRRCAEADRDPQNISDRLKDCGSFVDEKLQALHRHCRILTNNANIII